MEVKRRGDVRRAKLYYLRERSGKSARIKEKLPARTKAAPASAAWAAPAVGAVFRSHFRQPPEMSFSDEGRNGLVFADLLAFDDQHLVDHAGLFGLPRYLHLHRFNGHDHVADRDMRARLYMHFGDDARDGRLDCAHGSLPSFSV